MIMLIRYCVVIILCFANFTIYSQENIKYARYTTANGLSDNRVTTIIKDRDGFMWFGTWVGISRFDGNRFTIFKSYPGDRSPLKNNRIDDIIEDRSTGDLWIKAYDKQIYRFNKKLGTFSALSDLLSEEGVKNVSFLKILSAANNSIWLESDGAGIFLVTNASEARPRLTKFSTGSRLKLPSNEISSFIIDRKHRAWIGTSKGLRLFSRSISNTYSERKLPSDIIHQEITSVLDGHEKFWLTNKNGNLFCLDSEIMAVKDLKISDGAVNHLFYSSKAAKTYCFTNLGEIIAVTKNGKLEYLGKVSDHSPLFAAFEDTDGNLWVESKTYGIVRFDVANRKINYLLNRANYPFKPDVWNSTIFQDKNGQVWINLKEKGIFYYDRERHELRVFSNRSEEASKELSNNIIRCYYDSAGVMWIGSGFDGIEKVVFKEKNFFQYIPKPNSTLRSENETRGIYSDRNNRIWFGTKDWQLHITRDNRKVGDIFIEQPQKHGAIYTIIEDWKGDVWLGTKPSGLLKAEPVDASHHRYRLKEFPITYLGPSSKKSESPIYSLFEDNKRRLWAGTFGDGIVQVIENNGQVEYKTIYNSFFNYPKGNFYRIRHLAEDARGNIWVGTTGGLLVFSPTGDPKKYIFKIYRKELGKINSLGGDEVQFVFRDSRNRMWVLTSAGGLNLAVGDDPTKHLDFVNYSTKNGLPSDCLLSCNEDSKGNLWLATQNGISKFDTNTRRFQNFDHNDGIHQATFSEASCTVGKDGEFVFGTTFGYLSFNPEKVKTMKTSAKLAFTNIQINSADIVPGEKSPIPEDINGLKNIELKHDQNGISIEFALLDYRSVEKQAFSYRLSGFDEQWRSTEGQRRATYTNLPPGKYTFAVKSLNGEIYNNLPYKSIEISIMPPFWKTWWAYLIYVTAAFGSFLLVKRVAGTMLRLRHSVAIEKRMSELKLDFFTQISHELRTPLSLIMSPSEEVLKNEDLSSKGRDYMGIVVKNVDRMVKLVNQVLDLRKVQSGQAVLKVKEINLKQFIEHVIGFFKGISAEKNVEISLEVNSELNLWGDEDKLEIVLFNVLANAIKYSPNYSRIEIQVKSIADKINIRVIDQGPGVKDVELDDIFKLYYEGSNNLRRVKGTGIGLALSKELIQLHKGTISAFNHQPNGLCISIELYANRLHLDDKLSVDEKSNETTYVNRLYVEEGNINLTARIKDDSILPTVLIVEDNDDLRNFLTAKLEDRYNVEVAANGLVGLNKALDNLPDLILSDIMMPEMDGIEMLDRLKNNLVTSHIPVILLTAKHSIENQIEGLKYGADYYLTKPLGIGLLEVAIENILRRRRQFSEALVEDVNVQEDKELLITEFDREFLEKIIKVVEERLDDGDFNIDYVADSLAMSRTAFFKKVKSLTDLAPVEFVRDIRLQKAKGIFDNGEENISVVAYAVGFGNPKYFSTCFKLKYQQTPSEYLKSLKIRKK